MSVTPGRRAAQAILAELRAGALLDRAAAGALAPLEGRERAFAQELAYGTVRLRGRLDFVLDGLLRSGVGSVAPAVLDVLRLGAYQLLEMGGVPPYAAVSQSVEGARAVGHPRAAGLVNGVLQALSRRERVPAFPDAEADPVGHLTAWGAHPRWLVERWAARFGLAATRALVTANNQRPDVYLRLVEGPMDAALRRLADAGIEAEAEPLAPLMVRLAAGADVARALDAVPAVVQDPAASLVVAHAAFPDGARVADLCAAPGGKAVTLAAAALPATLAARGRGYVVAADLSAGRLTRVRENAERVGARGIGLVAADARRPPLRPLEGVLVDAPCTGTGTLRRHPDGKWRLAPRDVEVLAALQAEILRGAAGAVRAGGVLVYATCSLEVEENETQVERFLEEHPDFRLEPGPAFAAGTVDASGYLRVLPQAHGSDGAFAARMVRER